MGRSFLCWGAKDGRWLIGTQKPSINREWLLTFSAPKPCVTSLSPIQDSLFLLQQWKGKNPANKDPNWIPLSHVELFPDQRIVHMTGLSSFISLWTLYKITAVEIIRKKSLVQLELVQPIRVASRISNFPNFLLILSFFLIFLWPDCSTPDPSWFRAFLWLDHLLSIPYWIRNFSSSLDRNSAYLFT